jgi:PBP1b-binding outer membrane lipoprotein LpoB
MRVKIITIIFASAVLLTGCAQKPVQQNDYFNTLKKSKQSLDELKKINEETKAKADAYEKEINNN